MKKQEIKELLSIVPNIPAMNFFHISDKGVEFCEELKLFCDQKGYDYDLVTHDDKFLEVVNRFDAKKIDYDQAQYNNRSKLYDFVFVTIDLKKLNDLESFFKKVYMIIMNGGKLLVFIDNNQTLNQLNLLLQKCNYVAVNEIDMLEDSYILSATRLHGWDKH